MQNGRTVCTIILFTADIHKTTLNYSNECFMNEKHELKEIHNPCHESSMIPGSVILRPDVRSRDFLPNGISLYPRPMNTSSAFRY